jgi:hypothetical protein
MKRQRTGWLVVCLLGAVSGLFLALILASPGSALVSGPFFLQVLAQPILYWPYPTFGVLIALLTFYLARLVSNPN